MDVAIEETVPFVRDDCRFALPAEFKLPAKEQAIIRICQVLFVQFVQVSEGRLTSVLLDIPPTLWFPADPLYSALRSAVAVRRWFPMMSQHCPR
jgi:hypothetical protein